MKILITGISGFVGLNLARYLISLDEVTPYGLDVNNTAKSDAVKIYRWDELDRIPEVDIIFHLAGKAHDTKNHTNSESYFEINTGLTQKIYDLFLESNAKKFVFFSSVKAAADRVVGNILTEEVIPKPVGPYGESKLAAEKYILQNIPERKQVYILRPCMIHGSGNKGNLNLLYKLVSKGLPWPLGAFGNERSFTSMDNLMFVIEQLIKNEIESGIYQIADDETLSTNKLIELIASSQGKKARIWKINSKLISFAASVGDKLHLPLNSERLKKLTESYAVSNKKLKQALGIEKMPVSAEEGMKKTLSTFK